MTSFCKVKSLSASQLRDHLIKRGVVVAGQRRAELEELCLLAEEVRLEFDPDGIYENREEVIGSKMAAIPEPSSTSRRARFISSAFLQLC